MMSYNSWFLGCAALVWPVFATAEPPMTLGLRPGLMAEGAQAVDVRTAVIAGSSFELLHHGGGPTEVEVFRITGTRKVALAKSVTYQTEAGWLWKWDVPSTRGPVTYEAKFGGAAPVNVRIDVRDRDWLEAGMKFLKSAKWESEGIRTEERGALTQLGMHVIAKEAPGGGPALLRLTSAANAGGGRRELILDDSGGGAVVWRQGITPGDWRIQIPRAWISKSGLSRDEGLIRLLDLLVEQPSTNP